MTCSVNSRTQYKQTKVNQLFKQVNPDLVKNEIEKFALVLFVCHSKLGKALPVANKMYKTKGFSKMRQFPKK